MTRTASTDSVTGTRQEPVLGLSADPGKDINEAIEEIQGEVERARKELNQKTALKQNLKQKTG